MMKHRIAVIVPGGVGNDMWIPSLVHVLHRLSIEYTLTVYSYSFCIPHTLLTGPDATVTVPPAWCRKWRLFSFIYFILKIRRDHRDRSFTMLHSFWIFPAGVTAMTVHMLLRIRHVLSLPGGDAVWLPSIQYGGMKSAVHRRIVGACCAAADAVVLLTEYQKTQAEQNGIHVPHARVIPYGVDTGRFVFEPLDFSIPLRLISIGSLNKVKNIFLQIETYAILRRSIDCQFTIVGEDIMNGEARRFADSLHVGHLIHWKGQCVHSAIPALLHEAHVLLHTAFFEAEGVVIMEAFSAGTLVVGTRVGLLADTDRDGECTITADDPVHLAEKILSLVADRPLAARIREKNRLASAHMTIDVTAREYAALYNEVIETGLSPRADGRARPGYSG